MTKRNWFEGLKNEDRIICGEDGTAEYCIPYVFMEPHYGKINLLTWHSGCITLAEQFETEQELDSFIEALTEAKKIFKGE